MNMCFFTTYGFSDCFSVLSFSVDNNNFFRDNRVFRSLWTTTSLIGIRIVSSSLNRWLSFMEYVVFCMYIFIVIHKAAFNKSFFTLDRNIYYFGFSSTTSFSPRISPVSDMLFIYAANVLHEGVVFLLSDRLLSDYDLYIPSLSLPVRHIKDSHHFQLHDDGFQILHP